MNKTKESPMFLTFSLEEGMQLLHSGELGTCSCGEIWFSRNRGNVEPGLVSNLDFFIYG